MSALCSLTEADPFNVCGLQHGFHAERTGDAAQV